MDSKTLSETLWILLTFSGVGAVIDFMIGKGGQKELRTWLETSWYRYADVKWGDFGKWELMAFIRITDTLFGARLFSWRRGISTVIVAAIGGALPLASYLFPDPDNLTALSLSEPWWWSSLPFTAAYGFAFALSISFSRIFSIILLKFYSDRTLTNLAILTGTLIISYAILVAWSPAYNGLITDLTIAISLAASSEASPGAWLDFVARIPAGMLEGLGNWIIPSEYWNPTNILQKHIDEYLNCQLVSGCGWRALDVVSSIGQFLLRAGPLYRILVLAAFLLSFILEWLIRKPTFVVWARIVESDKPIFTLVLGGIAAAVKMAMEIYKHYTSGVV